ncbi:MAG: flagellar motor switch protein FliN [Alphaproteobacteria bacterium]|nr:flagellar motor switch protein FliN [Alphaproteobacteria bacterium]
MSDTDSDTENLSFDELEAEAKEAAPEGGDAAAESQEVTEYKAPKDASDLEAVYDIPVQVSAVLGKARMKVSSLMKLGRGTVLELDRKVGEAIDIYVNNRLVARGEVVLVDQRLGVTMTEIIKSDRRSSAS